MIILKIRQFINTHEIHYETLKLVIGKKTTNKENRVPTVEMIKFDYESYIYAKESKKKTGHNRRTDFQTNRIPYIN